MKLEQRYSANRVAAIALCSSVGIVLALAAMTLPVPFSQPSKRGEITWYLSMLVVAVFAGILTYRTVEAFRRGIADDLWDKASLDRLYGKLDRRVWRVLTVIVVIGLTFFFILAVSGIAPFHRLMRGATGMVYFWLSPIYTWGALKTAIRPRPNAGGPSIWTTGVKPISSDHWGEY